MVAVVGADPVPTYSVDGEPLGEIEPGASYAVLLVEDGWALALSDSGALFWLELGDDVETIAPSDDPALAIDPLSAQ